MDINKIFEELVKKVSRKGRLILIGIIALIWIKQPETITWSIGLSSLKQLHGRAGHYFLPLSPL